MLNAPFEKSGELNQFFFSEILTCYEQFNITPFRKLVEVNSEYVAWLWQPRTILSPEV